jgi:PAS domain S-box-containing protein
MRSARAVTAGRSMLLIGMVAILGSALPMGGGDWPRVQPLVLCVIAAMAMGLMMTSGLVSESPRISKAARESESTSIEVLASEVVEASSDFIYTLDLQGRFTSLNPAALRALGYAREEVPGLTTEIVVAPECWSLVRHMRETKLATGASTTRELTVVAKDGTRILLEVSSNLIVRDGQPVGIVGIGRNLTQRRHAERVTYEGNQLLDVLLENSRDMIYFKDQQSRLVRYSKAYVERVCGRPQADRVGELVGKSDFDFFLEEHARAAFEDEQRIMRTGQPVLSKLERETHTDGRITWVLTSKMPWRDRTGKVIGTFGISKDVTALKEAEDKLASERELLRTLLDNVPECIYFKDLTSRFVHLSRSKAQKTLKHSPDLVTRLIQRNGCEGQEQASDTELLIGMTDFDMFGEDHARRAYEDEQQIIKTGRPIIGKVEKETHPDGSVSWSLSTKMPWRDRSGKIIGTFGISKDITEIKCAEMELEATHKSLLQASRTAGMAEVATDVLHNVGNILNSVNVSCSLVIDRIQESNFSNLSKVPELIRQNVGRLETFLTADERGKHLTEYVASLAQMLADQKTFLLRELNQLRAHVDHIKQVVSMQQSYAKVAGVEEKLELQKLIEDALHINR